MNNQKKSEAFYHKSIRLKGYDYTSPGAYFITICAYQKKCIFGRIINNKMHLNKFGKIVETEWIKTSEIRKNILLDEYVVMPNHFHGIIFINNEYSAVGATQRVASTKALPRLQSGSIGAIIGQFKSIVTKIINTLRKTQGLPLWQRNYYEHIIRNEKELNRIQEYIINNPIQWEIDIENPDNTDRKTVKEYYSFS